MEVARVDGSTALFEVNGTERATRNAFPTRRVYGDLPYTDKLVVHARLVRWTSAARALPQVRDVREASIASGERMWSRTIAAQPIRPASSPRRLGSMRRLLEARAVARW